MLNVKDVAPGLEEGDHGLWFAKSQTSISYPEEGNTGRFAVEDGSFWYRHRNRCIVEAMRRYPPGGFLLDVGGGNGFVSAGIRAAGFEALLIEPGIQGAMNAQRRGLSPIICATLQDASFGPGSVPAAGMFDVLEHVEDDVGFLREVAEVLVPGGRLYLTLPAYQFLFSSEDKFAGHFRRYTVSAARRVLETAGFEVDYATYIFAWLPLPVLLFRTIPSRLGLQKVPTSDESAQVHKSGSFVKDVVEATLAPETRLIRGGWRLPVGGSCLLVARHA